MLVKKLNLTLLALAPCLCAGSVLADPISDDRLQPGLYPAAPTSFVPTEEGAPPFEIDWSLGLRGTQISSSDGNSFSAHLRPELDLRSLGNVVDTHINAHVELARGSDPQITPTTAAISITAGSQLNENTRVEGEASLKFDRELLGTPGFDPQIIRPADITTGHIDAGMAHRFGQFNLRLNGQIERVAYGATERRDTGTTDNSDQNRWSAEGTLRLGYQITPIVEVYGEGQLGRHWFDQAGKSSGQFADAYTRNVKMGVSGNWQERITAHAAVGMGQYIFTSATQPEVTARLYEAGVTWRPDPTLSVTGLLARNIEPTGADSAGSVRVIDSAKLSASYQVNNALALRTSSELAHSRVENSGETEDRRSAGLGADYGLNTRTKLSADYNYAHRTNSATGTFDSHQLSVGVTLKR